ncbi:MAG: 50S ribosomal protein L4 [Spirochaetaceae bacterium]|nr:MAG: 50S ribosomal protein L4 [Spirochaetaceae bacterium]
MDAKVLSTEGKEQKTIQLNDRVFGREYSEGAVYHAVRNELANARVGTAKTKSRSEVIGSRRKPWRQKGTGRARSGTRQSPVWVGGGTAFGPIPRDYSYRLPRKMKQTAFRSLLSKKLASGALVIVEDFQVESGKTKDLVGLLHGLCGGERSVLIMKDEDRMLKRAANNVPWLSYQVYSRLMAHDLFYARKIVVMESAAVELGVQYGEKKVQGK